MSEEKDRYAEARSDLRETAKWYSAALAALGVGLAGGLSFGILPDLGDDHLEIGILVGIVVVLAILAAITAVQEILFPEAFDRDRLKTQSVIVQIDPYLDELLPADITTLDELWTKLENTRDEAETVRLRTVLAKITSFAAFFDLQNKVRKTNRLILFLFVVACAGVGLLAYLQGIAKRDAAQAYVAVEFAPGDGWQHLAEALSKACPANGPVAAEGLADTPFTGWWTIRLKQPEPCAGAQFSVPAAILSPGKR